MINLKKTTLNFWLYKQDDERLRRVADRLSLSRSEIARRAMRLGIGQLEDAKLPGGLSPEQRIDGR